MTNRSLMELPPNPLADRVAEVTRNTSETRVRVKINLDGTGQSRLSTGIGGHMHHRLGDRTQVAHAIVHHRYVFLHLRACPWSRGWCRRRAGRAPERRAMRVQRP